MSELDKLKREREKLLTRDSVIRDMESYDQEKKQVKSDIWKLKHRKTVKVISVARRSTQGVGMIFGSIGKSLAPVIKQGAMNFAENSRGAMTERKKTVRRVKVKKVKKTRGKKPKKRVVRKKVIRRNNSFNPFGL